VTAVTGELGQDSCDKSARIDCQNLQRGQDSWDRTAGTGQLGQESWGRIAVTRALG
jgi:hypothetical protein